MQSSNGEDNRTKQKRVTWSNEQYSSGSVLNGRDFNNYPAMMSNNNNNNDCRKNENNCGDHQSGRNSCHSPVSDSFTSLASSSMQACDVFSGGDDRHEQLPKSRGRSRIDVENHHPHVNHTRSNHCELRNGQQQNADDDLSKTKTKKEEQGLSSVVNCESFRGSAGKRKCEWKGDMNGEGEGEIKGKGELDKDFPGVVGGGWIRSNEVNLVARRRNVESDFSSGGIRNVRHGGSEERNIARRYLTRKWSLATTTTTSSATAVTKIANAGTTAAAETTTVTPETDGATTTTVTLETDRATTSTRCNAITKATEVVGVATAMTSSLSSATKSPSFRDLQAQPMTMSCRHEQEEEFNDGENDDNVDVRDYFRSSCFNNERIIGHETSAAEFVAASSENIPAVFKTAASAGTAATNTAATVGADASNIAAAVDVCGADFDATSVGAIHNSRVTCMAASSSAATTDSFQFSTAAAAVACTPSATPSATPSPTPSAIPSANSEATSVNAVSPPIAAASDSTVITDSTALSSSKTGGVLTSKDSLDSSHVMFSYSSGATHAPTASYNQDRLLAAPSDIPTLCTEFYSHQTLPPSSMSPVPPLQAASPLSPSRASPDASRGSKSLTLPSFASPELACQDTRRTPLSVSSSFLPSASNTLPLLSASLISTASSTPLDHSVQAPFGTNTCFLNNEDSMTTTSELREWRKHLDEGEQGEKKDCKEKDEEGRGEAEKVENVEEEEDDGSDFVNSNNFSYEVLREDPIAEISRSSRLLEEQSRLLLADSGFGHDLSAQLHPATSDCGVGQDSFDQPDPAISDSTGCDQIEANQSAVEESVRDSSRGLQPDLINCDKTASTSATAEAGENVVPSANEKVGEKNEMDENEEAVGDGGAVGEEGVSEGRVEIAGVIWEGEGGEGRVEGAGVVRDGEGGEGRVEGAGVVREGAGGVEARVDEMTDKAFVHSLISTFGTIVFLILAALICFVLNSFFDTQDFI